MAQGRYTYTLDVENSRALKKLADFAKASEKATQRFEKDFRSQKQTQLNLGKQLRQLKLKYEDAQNAARGFGVQGKNNKDHIESIRRLKKEIKETRDAYAKARQSAASFNAAERKRRLAGATQYGGAIGPAPAQRGFRGNTGKRAALGSGLSQGLGAAGGAAALLTGGIAGLAAAITTKALQAFEDLAKATLQFASDSAVAAAETEKMLLALKGVSGQDFLSDFGDIKKVMRDFNVPLQDAASNFTKFKASAKASGLTGEETTRAFRGLIAANKALGGSQDQANGILLAATQILSKGKVTAEELRGQIGERLPGAVALFAKSMGMTTAELDKALEDGTVSVEQFVGFTGELLEKFEKDAKNIGDSPAEAGAKLAIELDLLKRNIGNLLMPIGAEFQKVFTEIAKVINRAVTALNNFLGLGTEGAINKTQRDLNAAQDRFNKLEAEIVDPETGEDRKDTGSGQGSRTLSRKKQRRSQALADMERLSKELKKLTGAGSTGNIDEGEMVTRDQLIKNRKGKGTSPEKIAEQVARIQAASRRRVAEEAARQQRKLAEQTSAIEKRLEKEKQDLVLSGLRGAARAQQQTINAYLAQNTNLEDQLNRLDASVTEAEKRVAAAKKQVDDAANDVDRARAQGTLDKESAKLIGAKALRANFAANIGTSQENNFDNLLNQSTSAFRERAAALKDEAAQLKLRNRLQLEGFSPQMIEMQLEQARITQDAAAQEKQFNLLLEQGKISAEDYAEAIKAIRDAANGAKEALEGLNSAQNGASQAIGDYISSATEFVTDTRARVTDMFTAIDSALANSINSVLTGTMSIQEAFHSFFKSVGQAFLKLAAQMIAKLIIINLLKSAFSAFGGGGPSSSLNIEGIQQYVNPTPLPTLADFKPFAKGGIVNKPTTALIGEGGMNEAVVPLPDGKSIPVDMGKGGASNIQTNITVNVDQGGQADSDLSGDNANKLGLAINSAVKRVIMDERRAGGLLYNGRR